MRSRVVLVSVLVGTSLLVAAPAPGAGPCGSPTIRGTSGDDRLRGTPGADVIAGLGGDDRLLGLGGDDVLCGGSGQDVLVGGPGADELHGETDAKVAEDTDYYLYYGDTLDGGPGSDLLDGGLDPREEGSHDSLTFAGLPEGVTLDLAEGTATSGEDTDTIVGTARTAYGTVHDDLLLGSDADESLYGDRGSDTINGRAGDDNLDGADIYHEAGDTSPNIVLGGPGADVVDGDAGDDLLRGGPGNDMIQAHGGADRSYAGPGRDGINDEVGPGDGNVLDGGPGVDSLVGLTLEDAQGRFRGHATGRIGIGPGTLHAAWGAIVWDISITSFEDVSTPPGDHWVVRGTNGPETIYAGFFSDPIEIYARGGNDRVFGSDRDDVINGGAGRDVGSGWAGHDRVVSVERIFR